MATKYKQMDEIHTAVAVVVDLLTEMTSLKLPFFVYNRCEKCWVNCQRFSSFRVDGKLC